MGAAFRISKKAARQFLLSSTRLTRTNELQPLASPEEVLKMVKQLECVQLDAVAMVERNHHLVLAARLPNYEPERLNTLLMNGEVFEYVANAQCIIPIEDYPFFESIRRRYRLMFANELSGYDAMVRSILDRIEKEGPLSAGDFISSQRVNGYWDHKGPKTKLTSHVLNLLNDTGEIRVVKREGNIRYFDLAIRTITPENVRQANEMSNAESGKRLLEKYMRAYGIFDLSDSRFGWNPSLVKDHRQLIKQYVAEGKVIPLDIEGISRPYFVLAEYLSQLIIAEKKQHESEKENNLVALLPPLDNILWSRSRLSDLFEFHYKWEIYMPASQRRYGCYAMPILWGDRFIGRMDPKIDRKRGVLVIHNIQIEPDIQMTKALEELVVSAIRDFADFHKVHEIEFDGHLFKKLSRFEGTNG